MSRFSKQDKLLLGDNEPKECKACSRFAEASRFAQCERFEPVEREYRAKVAPQQVKARRLEARARKLKAQKNARKRNRRR